MSLQMKTSLLNLLFRVPTERHPRVIDLDRGKTLAKGNVHRMNFFLSPYSAVKDPDQFGRSVIAVMYSSNKLSQSQQRVNDIYILKKGATWYKYI